MFSYPGFRSPWGCCFSPTRSRGPCVMVGDVRFAYLLTSILSPLHPKAVAQDHIAYLSPSAILRPYHGIRAEPAPPRLQIHSHCSASSLSLAAEEGTASRTSLTCAVLMSSTTKALSVRRGTLLLAEKITGSGKSTWEVWSLGYPSQEMPGTLKRACHCHEPGVC